jgi:DNA-binding LacI/PurR family transcriptional regulator
MGYLPNAIARGLATKRSNTIGVVVMDIVDSFIAELVRTIDNTALDYGYSVILSHCGADPDRELAAVRILRQQRVDGIIVPDSYVASTSFPLLEEIGRPVVLINQSHFTYSVGTDNVDAARQAVDHLLDLGHARIAYIGSHRHKEESMERLEGYRLALRARGLSPDLSLVNDGDDQWFLGGWQGIERLLKLTQPPSAVFCFNDLTAVGVIGAARELGLNVPGQLSVVGFDDIDLAPYLAPPLTTVAQQTEEIAQLAVEMILKLLAGQEPAVSTVLPGRLVIRGSTAPPARHPDTFHTNQ